MRTTYRTPRHTTRAGGGASTARTQLIRRHDLLKSTAPAMRTVR
jgi:hypothetical protein